MSQEIAWNGAHALMGHAPAAARVDDGASALRAGGLTVERTSAARLAGLADDWRDLLRRADAANVFMNPAVIAEAIAAYPERNIIVLLAWQDGARLLGVWAFAAGRLLLSAPAMPNAYLSTPVIDRDWLEPVLGAFLSFIDGSSALPKTVALDAMGAETATYAALARVTAARSGALTVFSRGQRPKLASALDAKTYFEQAMSASSRKKLRQHRRRLGERGALRSVVVREADAVGRAFEDFLALEAEGWKGRQRTALASDAADARYTRAMIAALAVRGDAEIHSLTLDGRPVGMQVVLRAGRTAFTWKTCYDEALHDFSPGTLLFEDYTARLLADDTVDSVDSCSFDDSGYMATWRERSGIANLWVDARAGGSFTFAVLAGLRRIYLALRARAKTVYLRHLKRTR